MRFLLALVGLASVVGSGSGGPGVQTLYRSSTHISSFAQDGNVLAWFSTSSHRCNQVHVLSLGGARLTLPKPGTSNVTCRWSVGGARVGLAVASHGSSALWTLHDSASVDLDYVVGADARRQLERRFYQLAHTRAGAGLWLGGIAGEAGTLVYSTTAVGYVDQVACLSGGSCKRRVVGGHVYRIVGRDNPPVPHTAAALAVAAHGARVAYVQTAGVDRSGHPFANAARPVLVRVARTGRLVSRIRPQGVPVGVAISSSVVALLERRDGKLRIDWYDAVRGSRLGGMRVPRGTSTSIAANATTVVYRVGRTIYGIDAGSGHRRRIVRAAAAPVGLSIAGRRLAWAENLKHGARIRALLLPRAG